MRRLGISVYPEHSSEKEYLDYIELASKYGFKRIFTCFLSASRDSEKLKQKFMPFFNRAHELGFEISADTNNDVFASLGITTSDIKYLKDIGIDIVRLDGRFTQIEEIGLTNNPYGIKVEFNASRDSYLEDLIRHGANKRNILVCHNFYPQLYSGLSLKTFERFNKKWIELGVRNAAFISSNASNTFGPWPVSDGLVTLEDHRGLPIDVQARHMIAMECIDDIFIGNAFATEEELKSLSEIDLSVTSLKVKISSGISRLEDELVFGYNLSGRDDESEYYIRCSKTRLAGKGNIIPRQINDKYLKRGDVVIVNDNLKHYAGEIEIILKDIPNDGTRNLIGHISNHEDLILNEMEKHHDHTFRIIKE